MSKFTKELFKGVEFKEYLERKYDTYCDIIDVASKNTLKIKQIFTSLIFSIATLLFGIITTTSCIVYVKYDCDITCFSQVYDKAFIYATLSIMLLLITFSIVCCVLNAIWYKRQWVYRQLKTKVDNEITIASYCDNKGEAQTIEEYENEFRDYKNDSEKRFCYEGIKHLLIESMVFIIPTIITILFIVGFLFIVL